ncbi:MAG: transglutaminase domain-containing protein [Verrucomicrobiota bacterium]
MSRTWLFPSLILWGWQAGLLPWAVAMGITLEAPRWLRSRLDIRSEDFGRLWNVTALLFFGAGLYLFLVREGSGSGVSAVEGSGRTGTLEGIRELSQIFLQFLRALPFIFFPFILAHAWSEAGSLPWSSFSLYTRARAAVRIRRSGHEAGEVRVDPAPAYLALTLFASSASVAHPLWYLPLLLGVLLAALWPWRNRGSGWPVRIGLVALLVGMTTSVPRVLNEVRQALQSLEGRLLSGGGAGNFDALRTVTSIGTVGRLQQSGRILLRIQSPDFRPPGLLREGVFNRFRGRSWIAGHRDFFPVGIAAEATVWRVAPGQRVGIPMTVARSAVSGATLLALPESVVTVRDLPVTSVETNYLGSARLRDAPPLVVYGVERGTDGGVNGLPDAADTDLESLGELDREAVLAVAKSLRLATLSAPVAVRTVERFFGTGFEYSLWQDGSAGFEDGGGVARFLRESRTGHCEFFATATVLLVRAAGVPARYVVGYSPEPRRDGEWVARGRDAHAWCIAFVDGRWREVDTTPGIWREREAGRARLWEGVADLFSDAWFRFALWRQQGGNWQVAVFAAGMMVLSWMGWRQLRGSRWRRTPVATASRRPGERRPGWDSEFYPVLERLEKRRGIREPFETLPAWFRRTESTFGMPGYSGTLDEALELHLRLRFDPLGLDPAERDRLRNLSDSLLLE